MRFLLALLLLVISASVLAQPGAPPPDPGDPVPLTGIEFLLGAGAALGIGAKWKSLRERFRK